ncbi:hypothetical protein AB4347_06080 [Vibrio breoganii]
MGSKRLIIQVALGSAMFTASATAFELEKSQSSLALVEQGCAYGRGALSIESAKSQAFNQLRKLLNGEITLSAVETQLFDEHFSQSHRDRLVSGIETKTVHANFGDPQIVGDDTCVTVRLTPPSEDNHEGFDIEWDDDGIVSIIVIGEGKADTVTGLTARQVAEQDAFRRAVSQVVGVMVQSEYQTPYSTALIDETFNLQNIAIQSLSAKSQGMITGWNEISSQTREDGLFLITLDVNVERGKINNEVSDIIKQLGNPAIYVDSTLPVIHSRISSALSELGFNLASSIEQSTLIVDVHEQKKLTPSGLQLALSLKILDRAGNEYGKWHNNPSLLTLPNQEEMLNELGAVHLAMEENKEAIRRELHSSMSALLMRGGPIREVVLSDSAAGEHGRLQILLSSIAGVSDVSIRTNSNQVIVHLRSMNSASVLAKYLEPTLRVNQPDYPAKLSVVNDFQIKVL